jgi:putative ABC transport system permease protein
MPVFEDPQYFLFMVVRTTSNPMAAAKMIQQEVAKIDKDQPVSHIRTMENVFSKSMAPRRFSVFLISVFAGIALVLSSIGIHHGVTESTE